MKTIHKRLYTVLPRTLASSSSSAPSTPSRVRSNSGCSSRSLYTASTSSLPFSFFDSPAPPPSSRPGSTNLVVSTRLAAEVKAEVESHSNSPYSHSGQQNAPQAQSQHSGPPPYSLAFSSGSSDGSAQLPSSHYSLFFPYPSFGSSSPWHPSIAPGHDTSHPSKRQRTRYHLDVGAYGIPKRSRGAVVGRDGRVSKSFSSDPQSFKDTALNRAVQVGEDAYFVRDNAMGVADGVGGWSKTRQSNHPDEPSASALFARRLMHYCCEGVDAARAHPGLSDASEGFSGESEALREQLEDQLEDLADGLDVLMILEKAFEKTIQAHVVPNGHTEYTGSASRASQPPTQDGTIPPLRPFNKRHTHADGQTTSLSPHLDGDSHDNYTPNAHSALPFEAAVTAAAPQPSSVPLLEGSSTALLAILEHPAQLPPKPAKPSSLFSPNPQHSQSPTTDRGAVIRIAHLGDCMAMLIRGEEIVWRTEEMWWNFNTPVQLGPASATKPHDAQIFTLPVVEDDILILASDGLSDNLWDEDILDEVIRFRRSFFTGTISHDTPKNGDALALRRGSLAGMLSEALCSRARCVSERRGSHGRRGDAISSKLSSDRSIEDDIPFGRRAREQGKWFHGGKPDDISVLVAVVSPVESS